MHMLFNNCLLCFVKSAVLPHRVSVCAFPAAAARLGLCGHERAAAVSGLNLSPKTLEMLSWRNRAKQPGGQVMHQLSSAFFAGSWHADISCWGPHFFLPQSHVLGAYKNIMIATAWVPTRVVENLLLGCFSLPTQWLKFCSLVISQAQVCGQLTRHHGWPGEENVKKGMSGGWGCFCFSFELI